MTRRRILAGLFFQHVLLLRQRLIDHVRCALARRIRRARDLLQTTAAARG